MSENKKNNRNPWSWIPTPEAVVSKLRCVNTKSTDL